MNSFKTAVIVVILLGVLYGVYRVLNMPEPKLSQNEEQMLQSAEQAQIDVGTKVSPDELMLWNDSPGGASHSPPGFSTRTGPSAITIDVPDLTTDDELHDAGARNEYVPSKSGGNDSSATSIEGRRTGFEQNPQPRSNYAGKGGFVGNDAPRNRDTSSDQIGPRAFERAWRDAEARVQNGEFRKALEILTPFYGSPDLTAEESDKLQSWLDPLAGKVIYSTEHLLLNPYTVQRGDTLEKIANDYMIPPELLYNINSRHINNPRLLVPGTELKVVRGPFDAQIDVPQNKLTLFVDGLYAGHFPIQVGNDPAPFKGDFQVRRIERGRDYITPAGQQIRGGDPNNPYGDWWIDLGSEVSIHGMPASGDSGGMGCISLSRTDIADVATILSDQSSVRIRR